MKLYAATLVDDNEPKPKRARKKSVKIEDEKKEVKEEKKELKEEKKEVEKEEEEKKEIKVEKDEKSENDYRKLCDDIARLEKTINAKYDAPNSDYENMAKMIEKLEHQLEQKLEQLKPIKTSPKSSPKKKKQRAVASTTPEYTDNSDLLFKTIFGYRE